MGNFATGGQPNLRGDYKTKAGVIFADERRIFMQNLIDLLNKNSYPGRGIVVGKSQDGNFAIMIYFIMGRSENSRNRVFEAKEKGAIITKPHDPAKVSDPSLIIYTPVRVMNDKSNDITIVSNGDQTDTIYQFLKCGNSFETALRTRMFEPDEPNFTPRISAIIERANGDFSYKMSILKSSNGNPKSLERMFFEYPQPLAGEGRFIHTYVGDGNPLKSFAGEPVAVSLEGNFTDI